jgi:hypothetical protein
MGLEGPLSDGGECGGLVAGERAVRDMMEVEREHETWLRSPECNGKEQRCSLTRPGDYR